MDVDGLIEQAGVIADSLDGADAYDDIVQFARSCADALRELHEQAHYANGVADLAMKHRDEAERERDALKAENEKFRAALHKLACLGNGNRYGTSIGNQIAQDALAARDLWQYYYRVDGCTAKESGDVNCICWHDEGTGPFAREEAGSDLLEWRLAARGE